MFLLELVPFRRIVASAVVVTLVLPVQVELQSDTSAFKAEANVTVADFCVNVPLTPSEVGAGEPITLIVSPGPIRAAVAPLVIVFQRFAKVVPSLASFPPS
jgi:hypothetical protein